MKKAVFGMAVLCVMAMSLVSCMSKAQQEYRFSLISFEMRSKDMLTEAKSVDDVTIMEQFGSNYASWGMVLRRNVLEVDSSLEPEDFYKLSLKESELTAKYEAAYKELRGFFAWVAFYLADSYYSQDEVMANLNRLGALTALQQMGITATYVPSEIKEWVDTKRNGNVRFFQPGYTAKILNALKRMQEGHDFLVPTINP